MTQDSVCLYWLMSVARSPVPAMDPYGLPGLGRASLLKLFYLFIFKAVLHQGLKAQKALLTCLLPWTQLRHFFWDYFKPQWGPHHFIVFFKPGGLKTLTCRGWSLCRGWTWWRSHLPVFLLYLTAWKREENKVKRFMCPLIVLVSEILLCFHIES